MRDCFTKSELVLRCRASEHMFVVEKSCVWQICELSLSDMLTRTQTWKSLDAISLLIYISLVLSETSNLFIVVLIEAQLNRSKCFKSSNVTSAVLVAKILKNDYNTYLTDTSSKAGFVIYFSLLYLPHRHLIIFQPVVLIMSLCLF